LFERLAAQDGVASQIEVNMTEKNLNAPAITPFAEPETVPSDRHAAGPTTTLLEEHPTPVAIGAEAPPSVSSLDLSASGPFGAY
jgi:hypothetical protein